MKIDIIIQTWVRSVERLAYLIVTYESLKRRMKFGDVEHQFHICAEADSILTKEIHDFCLRRDITLHWKNSEPSLSSSLNFCNSVGDAPYILFMQDDFMQVKNINIYQWVEWLEDHEKDWIIRLNWRDEFMDNSIPTRHGKLFYLNPLMRGYYYSDNPHLKKRGYHDLTGPFVDSIVDGKDQGRCENAMNGEAKQIGNHYRILCLAEKAFNHIGEMNTTLDQKDIYQKGR